MRRRRPWRVIVLFLIFTSAAVAKGNGTEPSIIDQLLVRFRGAAESYSQVVYLKGPPPGTVIKNLTIRLEGIEEKISEGICYAYSDGSHLIILDRKIWNQIWRIYQI